MKKLNIKLNTDSPLLYLLISLCAMNFLNDYFNLSFIIFFAVIAFRRGKVVFSGNFFILLLFGVLMMIFGFSYLFEINGINGLLKCFVYPISFFIGENMLDGDSREYETKAKKITMIIVFSLAFHGILNMINNFVTGGNQRNSIDVWTQSISAATRQACLFVLLCGSFFWCLFMQRNRVLQAVTVIFVAAMVYYNTVVIASRTIILLLIVGILLPLLLCLIDFSEVKSSRRYIFVRRVFITALLLLALYLLLYYTNSFGFRRMIDSSNLASRIHRGFFYDERYVSRKMYLNLMWQYPFGGNHLYSLTHRYGHDIILSALNTGGIPSALVLIIFFVSFVWQLIRFYMMKSYTFDFRLLIFTIYTTAVFQFALEPILDGEHWFFGCVLIISGMVNYLIKHPSSRLKAVDMSEATTD